MITISVFVAALLLAAVSGAFATADAAGGRDISSPSNTPPKLSNVSLTSPVDEGGFTRLSADIYDADIGESFQLIVNWGDGLVTNSNLPAGPVPFTTGEIHFYLDDDPGGTPADSCTVTVTVKDGVGAVDVVTTTITINNVAPLVDIGPSRPAPLGVPLTFDGFFTDPGVLDTHTWAWDFGDRVVTDTLSLTHTFATAGAYTVTLTVLDDDGGVGVGNARIFAGLLTFLPLVSR